MTEPASETTEAVLRRIRIISVASYFVFAAGLLITTGWRAVLGLTCGAVVTMINFLWLEQIANAILQPSPRPRTWKLSVRALARYALRSEEHTSELQSLTNLVCRLLL